MHYLIRYYSVDCNFKICKEKANNIFRTINYVHVDHTNLANSVVVPDIPFRGGGGHEMRINVKGTVGSFVGRKLICNKIITLKI